MSFNRHRMTGTLVLDTPMHIGTGIRELRDDGKASVSDIELDAAGNPYVTGSALKGIIRDGLHNSMPGDLHEAFKALFGVPPANAGPDEKGQSTGGKAHFCDAFIIEADGQETNSFEDTATAINEKTGAAKTAHLRTHKLVPSGSRFAFEIILDNVSEDDLEILAAIQRFLQDSGNATIGASTRFGLGRIRLESPKLEYADAASIVDWLKRDDISSWRDSLVFQAKTATWSNQIWNLSDEVHSAHVALNFDGFMLTQAGAREERPGQLSERAVPLRYDDEYVLTGRSIIGVLRARARRICATLFDGDPEDLSLFRELFGETGYSGALQADVFKAVGLCETYDHEMVAIDRFTGGGKAGAKFTNQVLVSPRFEGHLRLRVSGKANNELSGKSSDKSRPHLSDAAFGLLIFVLRDLIEGDLTFGSGATKGYGALKCVEIDSATPGSLFADILNPGSSVSLRTQAEAFLTSTQTVEAANGE